MSEVLQITGKDYADTYEKFNRFFLQKRWGDGLPLVPPTKEMVDWMLTGIDRPRDEVIVIARPSGRAVTVEALAISAVMAGAIPAYMPVVATALEAHDEVPWGWGSVTTTSSAAPFFVINGPIAKQLDINSKSNAIGYGWRANASIGRTIEMVFHTVGRAIPGVSDMSTLGYPTTFTSTVFAENEDVLDELGWTTYAEERGFDRKANTVTASVTLAGFKTIFHYEATNAEEVMEKLLWTVKPLNFMPDALPQIAMFILNPECVLVLARSGWSRKDVINQIANRGGERWKLPLKEAVKVLDWGKSWLTAESAPKWVKALRDDHLISVFPSRPDEIYVFVAGGAGKESHYYPTFKFASPVTKEIKLPQNWEEIVAKADIVPMPMPKLPW